MSNRLNLKACREKLEEERAALQQRVQSEENRLRVPAETSPDRLDLAQDYTSRARSSARLSLAQRELEQIEAALQRMDDGTYGQCAQCGNAINPERLEVLPQAWLCVACQQLQEKTLG